MPCFTASEGESVCLLSCLVRAITFITSIYSIHQNTPGRGATICNCFSQARTQTVPMAKKVAFLTRSTRRHVHRWNFPHGLAGRTVKLQEERDCWLVCFPKAQSCRCLQSWLQPHERSQITLLCHSPMGLDWWQHGQPLLHLQVVSWRCQLIRKVHPWTTTVLGGTRRAQTCQLFSLFTTQRAEVPKGGAHLGIPKDHGTEGNPWCWCPSTFCRLYLLSLVQQGGPKWGNCDQPSKDSPL